eukprot:COSAG01_NODE_478_length_16479_cov_45.015629_15_plen_135_part_00
MAPPAPAPEEPPPSQAPVAPVAAAAAAAPAVPAAAAVAAPASTPNGVVPQGVASVRKAAAKRRRKAKAKGCAVGLDREKRIVVHAAGGVLRVPRAVCPALVLLLTLAVFVHSGTTGEHIAQAEVRGAYTGSIDG